MAELIMTEDERHKLKFIQWSDEALGKACKKIACIMNDEGGKRAVKWEGAAIFLISEIIGTNAEKATYTIEGSCEGDVSFGDWEITFKRLNK